MKIVTSALLGAASLLLVIAPALSSSGDVRQNVVELPSLELQVQLLCTCFNISTRFVGDNERIACVLCRITLVAVLRINYRN